MVAGMGLKTCSGMHRLTATECLSHVWLRRKPPPPPPPQQQLQLNQQNIQNNHQETIINNDLLDNTKENLREFVDRWSENNISPSKIIAIPTNNEPLKQININQSQISNDNIIKNLNQVNNDNIDNNNINNNNNNENLVVKMDVENNPINRITDATHDNFNNDNQPGKKLKLDTAINYGNNNLNILSSRDNSSCSNINLPSPDSQSLTTNLINKDLSNNKSQPSSPIGTIPKVKTINNGNINNNILNSSSKIQSPIEINNETNKNSSIDKKLNVESLKEESLNKYNDEILLTTTTSDIKNTTNFEPINYLPSTDCIKNVNKSNSGSILNKINDKQREITINNSQLPPQIPGSQKSKLLHQFSVPNDLSKCTLHKNIPSSDSLKQQKENNNLSRSDISSRIDNSSRNDISSRIDNSSRSDISSRIDNSSRSDISSRIGNSSRSDINNHFNNSINDNSNNEFKFNKTLNKHVTPKIHGIVLGQSNDNNETNDLVSSSLSDKKGPRVITHKIFVEGRSEPVLPQSMSTSSVYNNKDNKKTENRVPKPITKSQTSSKLELKDSTSGFKSKPFFNKFLENDRFDRRGSDISCFLHNTENLERLNLADEIKKLSSRLFQMGSNNNNNNNNSINDEEENDLINHHIPITSYRNDPIGKFLANHGVVTRRPKYRVSYLNRDVPIGSPPPASNLFYHLSHSNSDNWSDNQTHSAPQSPSISPEREIGSLSKEVILRLFDKSNPSVTTKQPQDQQHSAISSIDSLASYFKTNNETKKNVPSVRTFK